MENSINENTATLVDNLEARTTEAEMAALMDRTEDNLKRHEC